MTGFGSAEAAADGRRWQVEVRTVNGRALKCSCRLPESLYGLETDIERTVAGTLARGSVTVTVRLHEEAATAKAKLNLAAIRAYIDELRPVMEDAGLSVSAGDVLSLPGVVDDDHDDDLRATAMTVLQPLLAQACAGVNAMRDAEGVALHDDVTSHLHVITAQLDQVRADAPRIAEAYEARLRQRMQAMLADLGAQSRDEDIIREVAIFAERTDIAEEISRLGTHVEQFADLLGKGDGPVGRTLDFLAQEMLREANTMGSKCQDADVARCIVEIKGAVDRIKEQVQNIE